MSVLSCAQRATRSRTIGGLDLANWKVPHLPPSKVIRVVTGRSARLQKHSGTPWSSHVRGISSRQNRGGRDRVSRSDRSRGPRLLVVPFRLTQENALRALSKHEQGRWMAPLSSEQPAATSTALVAWRPDCGMQAVFLPFRVVNAVASATYSGQVGYTRTVHVSSGDGKSHTRVWTDYFWVRGSLERVSFDGSGGDASMQIYADFLYPEALLCSVTGLALGEARPFTAAALDLKEEPSLDPFRLSVEGTRSEARSRIEAGLVDLVEREMRRTHPGCSHVQRITLCNVDVSEYRVRSVYLPAYVLITQYGERRLRRFVSGATGQVSGELTYSQVKSAVLGLGAGLLGSVAVAHMAEVTILAGPAAFTVAAVGSLAGLVVARWLPVWRNWWLDHSANDRASQHAANVGSDVQSWEQAGASRQMGKVPRSETGRAAKQPESAQSDGTSEQLLVDPRAAQALEVLGLELGCSLGQAQAAFRRQAMKLHPDHNKDASPQEQDAMAEELRTVLAAYRELRGLLAARGV